MPKPTDPTKYHPLNAQLFKLANQHGRYRTDGMTKANADSLRFDLNGYKNALKHAQHPDWEDFRFSSISIRKLETIDPINQHLTHYIEIFAAGPAWTQPESYKAVLAGIERLKEKPKEREKEPEVIVADLTSIDALLEGARPKGTQDESSN